MKANELRLGNWIYDPRSEKEVQVNVENISKIYFQDVSDTDPEYYYEPIPLTEERLVKFGLFHDEVLGLMAMAIKDKVIAVDPKTNHLHIYKSNFIEGINLGVCEYVHLFQNAVRYLTGEEL